jgi:hypothetical protein
VASVWADTAEFVGHRNMLTALAPAGRQPAAARGRRPDRREPEQPGRTARGAGAYKDRFDLFDYNKDGQLSGAEVARGSLSDVYPAHHHLHRPPTP